MRKSVFLFFSAFFFVFTIAEAEIVPLEKAQKVALNSYTQQAEIYFKEITVSPKIESVSIITEGNQPVLYKFSMTKPFGYIIVAAEDRVVPVLAFSFSIQLSDENQAPAFNWIVNSYKNEIVYARKQNNEVTREISQMWTDALNGSSKSKNTSVVMPKTDYIKWDQGKYFNAMCPADTAAGDYLDNRVPTGCVATAMAIVMKYNAWPVTGNGSTSYTHMTIAGYSYNYGVLSANFGATTYNWPSMSGIVNDYNNDIAQLMLQCGVAVNMSYTPNTSGAYVGLPSNYPNATAEKAFKTYFRYPNVKFFKKSNYTDTEWKQKIKAQLDESHVVLYSGDDGSAGHAFVLDGYLGSNNDYYHFNFGWGGTSNGFFYLTSISPGSGGTGGGTYSFTQNQEGLFDLYNTTAGIESQVLEQNLTVYPNPASDLVNVDLTGFNDDVSVTIFDLNGKSVLFQNVTDNSLFQLNISDLKNGIYQIRVSDKNHSVSQKLVIAQ